MKYIGKIFEYYTHDGQTRTATCEGVEFHKLLDKEIFIGVSPCGHKVKLTKEEIHKWSDAE